jgi:hypothetical protein
MTRILDHAVFVTQIFLNDSKISHYANISHSLYAERLASQPRQANIIQKQSLATIAAQDGFQRTYYGRQLEDPNLLLLVIGVYSISDTAFHSL